MTDSAYHLQTIGYYAELQPHYSNAKKYCPPLLAKNSEQFPGLLTLRTVHDICQLHLFCNSCKQIFTILEYYTVYCQILTRPYMWYFAKCANELFHNMNAI